MGRKAVVLSVLLCLLGTVARGQNERFKALFLYNFTRYLEWPTSGQQDDFVILVAGKNAKITNELQQIAAKKTVGTLKMVVRESNDASEATRCNMVFVPSSERGLLTNVVANTRGKHVVVVSDENGGISQGASFNFIEAGGKTQFEVSPSTLENHGIKISSSLLSLGVVK